MRLSRQSDPVESGLNGVTSLSIAELFYLVRPIYSICFPHLCNHVRQPLRQSATSPNLIPTSEGENPRYIIRLSANKS